MYYELRIEPKDKDGNFSMDVEEVKRRIEQAFSEYGLSAEGVEILNID